MKLFVISSVVILLATVALSAKPKPKPVNVGGSKPKPTGYHRNATTSSEKNQNGWGWNSGGGGVSYKTPPACSDPSSLPANPNADYYLLNTWREYYYTAGSKFSYTTFAKMLLGHPVKDGVDLEHMCLTLSFKGGASIQIDNGYGRQFQQLCDAEGVSCPTTHDPTTYDGKFGVNTYKGFSTDDYTKLDSDGSTYVIYYRCLDGKFGDLMLLTTRPYPTVAAVEKFNHYLNAVGFSADEFILLKCNTPKLGWYPAPFQNYPQTSGGNLFGWGDSSNGWSSGPPPSDGWSSGPPPSDGWSPGPPPSDGWSSGPPPSNGWSSGPPPSNGWSPASQPPSGWSDSGSSGWGEIDMNSGWSQNNDGWSAPPPTNGWGGGWGVHNKENIVEEKKTEAASPVARKH